MNKLKKLMTFIVMATLVILQSIIINVNAEESDVKLGDKYDKKVVLLDNRVNEDLEENIMTFRFFKALSQDTKLEEENRVKTEELLVPKTDSNYEIALSYSNGDYTYLGKAEDYDEAVKMAQKEEEKVKAVTDEFIIPVVINTKQQSVTYATYEIGRCIKKYEGENDRYYRVCNMFKDENLTTLDRLTNDDCCGEMPLIENKEKSAKVYINGYAGWMNKDISRNAKNDNGKASSDVSIEPINQVTDPSFYYVGNDGLLYHYISITMTNEEVKIDSDVAKNKAKKIGKAPSYLEKNVKYLSYDGMHFYSTKTDGITTALCKVTDDLKAGNFSHSVNPNNPYYNYYLYLPFRSRTNYTAEELDKYIEYYISVNKLSNAKYENSKLRGIGKYLIKNQNKYGVNALLILSIAINESDGGTSGFAMNNNFFGLDATDYNPDKNADEFLTVDDGIAAFCKDYISRGYSDITNYTFYGGFLGNKGYGANVKYASDPYWADKAANNACKIENYLNGGNINNYKDYDYYQLFKFTKAGSVKDSLNNTMYNINSTFTECSGEFVGSTGILFCNNIFNLNGISCNEIVLDRTLDSNKKNSGVYNWSNKGYVNRDSIALINSGKTNTNKEDINKDGKVNEVDLAKIASLYNTRGDDLDYVYDINDDGIIDIYDIVRICAKI